MFYRQLSRFASSSLVKFAVTGVLNTLVGLGTIYALKWSLAMDDTAANAIGYVVGITFSLLINSRWTFQSRQPLLTVAPRYFLVLAIAYSLNLLCVYICIDFFDLNSYLAQACGVVPYTACTYIASRWWVFAAEREPA